MRVRVLLPLAVSLSLAALVAAAPQTRLQLPLALAALLWAPGDALLSLAYRGRALAPQERFALSCALGLALAPVLGLVVSLAWSLTALHVALAIAVEVGALTAAAFAWTPPATRDAPGLRAPSTPATFAIAGVALVVSGALFAWDARPPEAPAALAIADESGNVSGLPTVLAPGDAPTFQVDLSAGGAARSGPVDAQLVAPNGTSTPLMHEEAPLAAGRSLAFPLPLPPLSEGDHEIVVTWQGREVHLWLHVRGSVHA